MERNGESGRVWVGIGALAGLGTVAMAAAANHALTGRLDPGALAAVRSSVEIQGWHALALLFVGLWIPRGGLLAQAAGGCFVAGLMLFCTGVYANALGGVRLPMVAPAGGTILMLGWALLAASTLFRRR